MDNDRTCILGPNGHECDLINTCSYCGPCYYPTGNVNTVCSYVGDMILIIYIKKYQLEQKCSDKIDLTQTCNYKLQFPEIDIVPGKCNVGECVAVTKNSINQYECQEIKKISTAAIVSLVMIGLVLLSLLIWAIIVTNKKNKLQDSLLEMETKPINDYITTNSDSTNIPLNKALKPKPPAKYELYS